MMCWICRTCSPHVTKGSPSIRAIPYHMPEGPFSNVLGSLARVVGEGSGSVHVNVYTILQYGAWRERTPHSL